MIVIFLVLVVVAAMAVAVTVNIPGIFSLPAFVSVPIVIAA